MRCATDLSYYLSRLSLLFATNLVSVAGVIFAAVCLRDIDAGEWASVWTTLASISLLVFAILSVRSVTRTVRLARQVLQIRRKIRSVEFRKRRLLDAAERSSVHGQQVRLLQG